MGIQRIPLAPSTQQVKESISKRRPTSLSLLYFLVAPRWGTDEEGIIWCLGHRNADQRRKIRDTYQQLYNKSLIDDLHSELSGDFRV
ncbi:hypothetical protein Ancab_006286 [Ancistrocladus abbreviatus]